LKPGEIVNTSLDQSIAIVTGSGSGLGQAAAIALAAEGATIAVTELPDRIDRAEATVEEITAAGGSAFAIELDVRSLDSIAACVSSVVESHGRIDVLVNNAGVNIRKRAFDVSESDWDTVLDVNLKGLFFMAQAVGRQMRDQSPNGGSIINISSIMGLVGYWDRVAYCSSKAAIINMGRVLAVEWGEHNIRVNAVAPTFVETPLTRPLFESQPEFTADVHARTLVNGLPKPDEIAGAVVYLASAQARSVTGQVLTVDGGWTAH
jgi:NAD(P)-dependent dehydrogenase (short-subunit alcohol dehydrogenase family)